jgi:hypothetical protein
MIGQKIGNYFLLALWVEAKKKTMQWLRVFFGFMNLTETFNNNENQNKADRDEHGAP